MYKGSSYVCPQCTRKLVSGMTVINDRPTREYRCWCGYRMALTKRTTMLKVPVTAVATTAHSA